MTMPVPRPTPVYRLLHETNLPLLLARGALHAPNCTPADGLEYRTIHRADVQDSRRLRSVPKGPRGPVHDYVPFYFGPRSVMLYQLSTGWVPGYSEGQGPLLHLVSTCESVVAAGRPFVFSDGHGLARLTDWYDDLADLERVDWVAVNARIWRDTLQDMDQQRRKQAEFLVHQSLPFSSISSIGVLDEAARQRVEQRLQASGAGWSCPVQVRRDWYY
jgi:hypothetical protein